MFEDEACFQQEGTTRRSWAKRGKGFTVYHHPCKRRSKFFGAVSVSPRPKWAFRKARTFNASTFQAFLEDVLRVFGRVCMILDNVAYHKAKKLRPFLRANRHRLWLYSLPAYSPDLNAAEPVWRETRKDATHNRYFPAIKRQERLCVHARKAPCL
ncbi:MAG: transposase [Candidatus Methylomirabilaceae bacterium]